METYIVFKNYGKGKERLILVNKSGGNVAFASFGVKDAPYNYLMDQYRKQEALKK